MMQHFKQQRAFTLIELLVTISVLGLLLAVLLPNLMGARERARDATRKNDLYQMKSSLRLYYNDFQHYPTDNGTGGILGCGESGEELCPNADGSFAVGNSLYMKQMPSISEYTYQQTEDGDNYLLGSSLENAADSDILDSVNRCSVSSPVAGTYYVCAD